MKLPPVGDEERELKEWLTGLLPDGMSRQDVADELRVSRKTISTMLNPDSRNFSKGSTMLGYLRLVGALREAPEAGAELSRLAALEGKVAAGFQALEAAIEQLAAQLRRRGQTGP